MIGIGITTVVASHKQIQQNRSMQRYIKLFNRFGKPLFELGNVLHAEPVNYCKASQDVVKSPILNIMFTT